MRVFNFLIIFIASFAGTSLAGHMTIAGFEDTLSHSEKMRLSRFIYDHKKRGRACRYDHKEGTVACTGSDGLKHYFF